MAIDERARHELYLRLEEYLGPEAATTLMEHLPPTGWADVATKRDLDQLRAVTKADLDQLRAVTDVRFDELRADFKANAESFRAELHKTISTHTVMIVFTTMATSIASVFAAARLH
jgi:hypothetical protein